MFDPRCASHSLTTYLWTKGIWRYLVIECENEWCTFVFHTSKKFRWSGNIPTR